MSPSPNAPECLAQAHAAAIILAAGKLSHNDRRVLISIWASNMKSVLRSTQHPALAEAEG